MTMVHATLAAGAGVRVPWPTEFNALGYVLAGSGTVGEERWPVHTGQLTVFGPGDGLVFAADRKQDGRSTTLEMLLLGGRRIREPVAWYGPFVMNTKAEIVQAYEDYQAGRLGTVPAEPTDAT
jgi:redox-sensitive bicupin YhaK (pirin superfamily)